MQKQRSKDASSKPSLFSFTRILIMVAITSVIIQFTVLNGLIKHLDNSDDSVDAPLTPSPLQQIQRRRTLHVIHCLSGNEKQFFDEWE
jgi:hypothetical protein